MGSRTLRRTTTPKSGESNANGSLEEDVPGGEASM